jgi:hypothetical protein
VACFVIRHMGGRGGRMCRAARIDAPGGMILNRKGENHVFPPPVLLAYPRLVSRAPPHYPRLGSSAQGSIPRSESRLSLSIIIHHSSIIHPSSTIVSISIIALPLPPSFAVYIACLPSISAAFVFRSVLLSSFRCPSTSHLSPLHRHRRPPSSTSRLHAVFNASRACH